MTSQKGSIYRPEPDTHPATSVGGKFRLVFLFIMLVILSGCGSGRIEPREVEAQHGTARTFSKMFSKSHASVGKYSGPGGGDSYLLMLVLYDRYIVKYSCDLSVSNGVALCSNDIVMVSEILKCNGGTIGWELEYGDSWHLSEKEVKAVRLIDDIFTLKGKTASTNAVPRINEYAEWKYQRL